MQKSRKKLAYFAVSYVAVLVPILLLSMLITQWNADRIRERETAYVQTRVETALQKLEDLQSTYIARANSISSKMLLSAKYMTAGFQSVQNGYNLLKDISIMDELCTDFFMYYHTDEIYSPKGYTHADTYFRSYLGCDSAEAARAREILDGTENAVYLLQKQNTTDGYLMYYCPVQFGEQEGITSTTFCISGETLMRTLPVFSQEAYLLTLSDGLQSLTYYFSDGRCALISTDQRAQAQHSGTYAQFVKSGADGMSVEVLYPRAELTMDVQHMNLTNYALLAVGVLLSMLLSLTFGKRRKEKLFQLEDIASGKKTDAPAGREDEYSLLRHLIRDNLDETTTIRNARQQYKRMLKKQLMQALLSGSLDDPKQFREDAMQCGIEFTDSFFFLIAIVMDDAADAEKFESLLEYDLFCRAAVENRQMLILLSELPSADVSMERRLYITNQLKLILHDLGLPTEKICFSSVYNDLNRMYFAYREVRELLNRQFNEQTDLTENEADSLQQEPHHPGLQLLQSSEFSEFSTALARQDETSAQELLDKLLRRIDNSPACAQLLLRCELMHTTVHQLNNSELDVGSLLNDLYHLNPADGAEFDKHVIKLAQHYCRLEFNPDQVASHMLQYIEAHFTDPMLSMDQITLLLGANRIYLTKLFKKKTGMSYIEFVTKLRMEKAAQLLRDTNLTVKQIVLQVGYIDDSSFRKKFNANFGVSISDYRSANQDKPMIAPSMME